MTKKLFALLVGLVLIISLFAGCSSSGSNSNSGGGGTQATETGGGGDTGGTDNSGNSGDSSGNNDSGNKIELSYWTLFNGGDGDFMQQIVDGFNKSQDKIVVKRTDLVWGEYYTKLVTAVSAGKGPDIGISHTSKLPELVAEGVVTPLDGPAGAAGFDWNEINSNILDSTIYDGEHYAVPLDTHPMIMYYNKKLLRDAGLLGDDDKPKIDPGADGFIHFVTTLKDKLPDGVAPVAFPTNGDDPYRLWWALYAQLGGNGMITDDLKSANLDAAKSAQAANYLKDLYYKYKVIPLNDADFYKTFQSQKAAITFTGVWATGTFSETDGLELGATAIPNFYGKEATWGDAHTMIIPMQQKSDPEKQKAIMEFMKYASENGQIWAKAGHIPANKTVLDNSEYQALPYAKYYADVANTVVFPKHSEKNWPIKDATIKVLDTIWSNSVSAEDGTKQIEQAITDALNN